MSRHLALLRLRLGEANQAPTHIDLDLRSPVLHEKALLPDNRARLKTALRDYGLLD